ALLYASVGFGGGSTYTALMILFGVPLTLVPAISLLCNLVVVSGGSWRYARAGITPWRRAAPMVLLAAPLAFLGGLTPVSEGVLVLLLSSSLLLAALLLLVPPRTQRAVAMPAPVIVAAAMGIGYLAGVVGIGGGIFLAPLLHLIRWAEARAIAATASLFILVNSLFGLGGQLVKGKGDGLIHALADYWPLLIAVAIGGTIGSLVGARIAQPLIIRRLTALLIAVVAVRLLWATLS
ncbi:MAG: hypothetical protein RLZZ58_1930, partial [Pseudomonadota bacterium]